MTRTFEVTGGCFLTTFDTDRYTDAMSEFLTRIKLTKPLTGAVIEFVEITDNEKGEHTFRKLIHRVVLE